MEKNLKCLLIFVVLSGLSVFWVVQRLPTFVQQTQHADIFWLNFVIPSQFKSEFKLFDQSIVVWAILVSMFPSFPCYKEDTGGRVQIEPEPLCSDSSDSCGKNNTHSPPKRKFPPSGGEKRKYNLVPRSYTCCSKTR